LSDIQIITNTKLNLADINETKLPSHIFESAPITEAFIPKGFSAFEEAIFANYTKLKNITIDSKMSEIPSSIFSRCTNLSFIQIGGQTVLENNVLDLRSVSAVHQKDFYNFGSIQKIVFPLSKYAIDAQAFGDDQNLQTIEFQSPPINSTLNSSLFSYCRNINCTQYLKTTCNDFSENIFQEVFKDSNFEKDTFHDNWCDSRCDRPPDPPKKKLNLPLIIGVSVAGTVVLAIVIVVIVRDYLKLKKKSHGLHSDHS
jgi:hypothetical protein